MTAKTEYYRAALSRLEANRILLAKVSAIPFSNDPKRSRKIRSAQVLQKRTRMNLGQLANAQHDAWRTYMTALDRDFKELEEALENLWSRPLSGPGRESAEPARNSCS